MKFLITILLIFSIQNSLGNTTTPRETFKTFLQSMVKIKNRTGDLEKNYKKATSTFQLSAETKFAGNKIADKLIKVLDKIKKIDYEKIPQNYDQTIWYFDKRIHDSTIIEIYLIKVNNKWLFSDSTLKNLDQYERALSKNKLVEGVTILETPADKIRKSLGKTWSKKSLFLENWQWAGILLLLLLAFINEKVAKGIISFTLNHSKRIIKYGENEKLSKAIDPIAKLVFAYTLLEFIDYLDFAPTIHNLITKTLNVFVTLIVIWFAQRVIRYVSSIMSNKAKETETKFDDILVPLLTKTATVISFVFGFVFILKSFNFDVSNIIAGLGIGGLAFAFAAKDMLANFFGSIMLVLDRPFDIGDVIRAGDIEGVVDEVGFRSTRIRTFNDSLITISNGEIMNRPIDNMGKRRFRRLVTELGVEYDTPAEKIEAFCEGIRQLIISYSWTRKDNFHVYFSNFGASSLDIKLMVYWKTDDYSRELAEKHRLLLDILRLSKELNINFAFPTQTLHMFSETKVETVEDTSDSSKTFQTAQEKAKNVAKKQIVLKNPRSNSEDKNQFGDNEFGI